MNQLRSGLGYGLSAYLVWGLFPVYFMLLAAVNPFELVSWRVISTCVFCLVLVTLTRRWRQLVTIFTTPRLFGWLALSSLLIYSNWQIYVLGVTSGHVLETALGYFINPLFTILIGVFVWRERLSRLQWIAVAIAALGVSISAIAYGRFPWIALGLAFSFGLYGAVRKQAGTTIDGMTALTFESIMTMPIAGVQLVVVGMVSGIGAFSHGPSVSTFLLLSGVVTGVPLMLFGEATRRLPLSYIGFLQFITPVLGFLYGYFVLHEEMSTERWVGFIGVWCALIVLCVDMLRANRRGNAFD